MLSNATISDFELSRRHTNDWYRNGQRLSCRRKLERRSRRTVSGGMSCIGPRGEFSGENTMFESPQIHSEGGGGQATVRPSAVPPDTKGPRVLAAPDR